MNGALHRLGLGVSLFGVLTLGGTTFAQANSTVSMLLSWQRVRNFFFQENEDPGSGSDRGSRPVEGVCLVTPGDYQTLWTQAPILVWQSQQSTVGIRPQNSSGAALWTETAEMNGLGVYQAIYGGTDLETGSYDWVFYSDQMAESPIQWFSFYVMEAAERERIAADLTDLEAELEAAGGDEEAIAQAKADYFLSQDLKADALQVLFAVEHPSEDLQYLQAQLVELTCPPPQS
jgi:hypothetical protein